jgi:hypothetical protein
VSLVATWVLATDGNLYKEPVLKGADWFLCFDDDDPPEIVVKRKPGTSIERSVLDCKRRASKVLDEAGMKWSYLSGRPSSAYRMFDDKMELACAFFIRIETPIPEPQEFEGKLPRKAFDQDNGLVGQSVVYLFDQPMRPAK